MLRAVILLSKMRKQQYKISSLRYIVFALNRDVASINPISIFFHHFRILCYHLLFNILGFENQSSREVESAELAKVIIK